MVSANSAQLVIAPYIDIVWDFIELTGDGGGADGCPISGLVSAERGDSEFKLGSCNSGVFFPNIASGSVRPGGLGVGWTKRSTYGMKSRLPVEGGDQLPVEESTFPKFELSNNMDAVWRQIGDKVLVGDREHPELGLECGHGVENIGIYQDTASFIYISGLMGSLIRVFIG